MAVIAKGMVRKFVISATLKAATFQRELVIRRDAALRSAMVKVIRVLRSW